MDIQIITPPAPPAQVVITLSMQEAEDLRDIFNAASVPSGKYLTGAFACQAITWWSFLDKALKGVK